MNNYGYVLQRRGWRYQTISSRIDTYHTNACEQLQKQTCLDCQPNIKKERGERNHPFACQWKKEKKGERGPPSQQKKRTGWQKSSICSSTETHILGPVFWFARWFFLVIVMGFHNHSKRTRASLPSSPQMTKRAHSYACCQTVPRCPLFCVGTLRSHPKRWWWWS